MDTNNCLCSATIDATTCFTVRYNAETEIGQAISNYITRMEGDALVTSVLVGEADFNFSGTTKVHLGVSYLRNLFMECIILPYIQNRKLPISLEIGCDDTLKLVNDVFAKWKNSIDEHCSSVLGMVQSMLALFAENDINLMTELANKRIVLLKAIAFNENPQVFIFPNLQSVVSMCAFLQNNARGVTEVDFRGLSKCADSDNIVAHNQMFKVFAEANLECVTLGNRSLSEDVKIGYILKDSLVALNILSEEKDINQKFHQNIFSRQS